MFMPAYLIYCRINAQKNAPKEIIEEVAVETTSQEEEETAVIVEDAVETAEAVTASPENEEVKEAEAETSSQDEEETAEIVEDAVETAEAGISFFQSGEFIFPHFPAFEWAVLDAQLTAGADICIHFHDTHLNALRAQYIFYIIPCHFFLRLWFN